MNEDDFSFGPDEFKDDKEREEFEKLWARYKQGKETMKVVTEYYAWLLGELQDKGYALVPKKFTQIDNLPLCVFKLQMFPHQLGIAILN